MRTFLTGLQQYYSRLFIAGFLLWGLALPSQAVVFQAENYTNFYDTSPGNSGGAYRSDAVDIEITNDSGGGYNVGWIEATEWLVYSGLSIPASGNYTIRLRVASPSGATASVDLNGGAIQLGNFSIPATGGWQNWTTVSRTVYINAGTYNLGVFAQTAGWNFNWIEVVGSGGGTTGLVTVYEHCNYGGWSAGFNTGSFDVNAMTALGARNDQVSSIRVAAGYEAVLFENWDFSGASVTVRGDSSCLSNFNDRTSSIIVRATTGNPPATGFSAIVSEAQFNQMFPNRNPFYTYAGLVEAAKTYPAFAGTGDTAMKKREAAAALANFSHETGGLVHVTEIAQGEYCGDWDGNPATCPCAPGKRYYGRGPIQLSWNGNYCAAGDALGLNLRADPDLVQRDAKVAWQTALWFWMTQSGAGFRPAHSSIVNGNGFGETIRTINGSLECNGGNPAQVQSRINEFNRFLNILGTTAGAGNIGC
ncbi:glycoside hydrolase family 19 protein [Cellvibrio japonicus]|uniref:Chitinase, putative, chi19A n=1 Tax=Cellvibrio japonicus (strain Ueda107) TaxID=498211 RepID=B3PB24_CELJU|nr:glycoside hydrolase family 19 protein [Cellvibrio japonicus]ACE85809.1 chitinase, putative, chi19A [Cellvibrio japonicus Ueda107]QEI11618.1 carbohydrate-binding protein [Cellvibrio japonicus]QEI15192.1 carbohydrate-binding protein [Cellvibrio japonicus]QEI18772.1 carbohydrate-binding protein [Cellvibrio japonicus]